MKALIDLFEENVTANILDVCNECVNDNQADKIGKAEMKDKETSKEIQNVSEKFDKFTSQLSKSFVAIEEMQQEVTKLKETKTYAAATGQNNPGKRMDTSENKKIWAYVSRMSKSLKARQRTKLRRIGKLCNQFLIICR